jgi:hypothetical protein
MYIHIHKNIYIFYVYIYIYLSLYSRSLWAGRFEVRIPVEARFSALFQAGPGANPITYKMDTEALPGVKRPGRGVDHTTHLAPRLKK